jgi:hypothetical protein
VITLVNTMVDESRSAAQGREGRRDHASILGSEDMAVLRVAVSLAGLNMGDTTPRAAQTRPGGGFAGFPGEK